MAAPTLVAVASSEWEPAARYLLSSGLCLVVGAALRFAALEKPRLDRTQAIAVTGIAWVFLSLLAAVPLWLSGHFGGYFDALFECISGLTTTGVSLAQDLAHLSNADNTWRFALQLVGGLGFIVVALSLGLFGRRIDASLYTSEGRSERFIPRLPKRRASSPGQRSPSSSAQQSPSASSALLREWRPDARPCTASG